MTIRRNPPRSGGPRPITTGFGIDLKSAAKLTGLPVYQLRARAKAGTIPHRLLNKRLVFEPEELRTWFKNLPGLTAAQALKNIRRK